MKLKLAEIKQHSDFQPRESINQEIVETYINTFNQLPPIIVFKIDEKTGWYLVDGWHRVDAARKKGMAEIEVIKNVGTWDEAREFSFDANRKHGLALSLKDRKKGAETKLVLHTERSNSWIAEECGLSDKTIESIREKLESNSEIPSLARLTTKEGKSFPRSIEKLKKVEDMDTGLLEVEEEPEEEPEENVPALGLWPLNQVSIVDVIEGLRGLPTESIDLVFTDPPYNLGKDYGENIPDKIDKYWGWCGQWFMEISRVLKKGGSFYIMHYPEVCAQWKQTLDTVLTFKRWITWVYNINNSTKNNWRRSHRTILFYTKGEPKHFDGLADGEPYKNPDDKRVIKMNPLDQGVTPTDVWVYQLVKNVSKEKTEWVNQLPLKLIERIIKISSMPNDIILDPFMGSGTIAEGAYKNNRLWIGFDLNTKSINIIEGRIGKL